MPDCVGDHLYETVPKDGQLLTVIFQMEIIDKFAITFRIVLSLLIYICRRWYEIAASIFLELYGHSK